MRIRLATVLAASLAALLVTPWADPRRTALADDAAPAVVVDKENDFEWKLPTGWTLTPPSASDKEQGYHAKARRVVSPGVECTTNVLVKAASGTSLDTFVSIMKENKLKVLTETEVDEADVDLGGATGAKSVTILGKAENNSSIKWFVRAVIVGDRYHQVSVMSSNAAHADVGSEIDEVFAGYHILSAPPPGEGAPAAKGKIRREFPNLGLSWTLPDGGERADQQPVKEGDPLRVWKWGFGAQGNPALARGANGLLAIAALELNGKVLIVAELQLPQTDFADVEPAAIVKNERNFEEFTKRNFDGTPIPHTDEDAKVGNARGAFYTMTGKSHEEGGRLFARFYFVSLQQQLFQLVVRAFDGAETSEADFLKALVGGLEWTDTSVGVRGPLASPFPTASAPRKNWSNLGKEVKGTGSVNFKKPAQFGGLSLSNAKDYIFAAETRKGGAYLFVSLWKDDAAKIGQGTPPFKLEALIDKHENDWKNELANPVTRGKGDKTNCKDASFKTGKGFSYEFRGEKDGFPFVEKGWVVKASKDIVWIRAQFGGKDAEKTMASDWKDFQGSINFK